MSEPVPRNVDDMMEELNANAEKYREGKIDVEAAFDEFVGHLEDAPLEAEGEEFRVRDRNIGRTSQRRSVLLFVVGFAFDFVAICVCVGVVCMREREMVIILWWFIWCLGRFASFFEPFLLIFEVFSRTRVRSFE